MKDMPLTEETLIEEMVTKILSYVSNEVNAIEAASMYMDENNIDADIFAEFIKKQPKLWSMIYESAVTTNVVRQERAMLTF